MQTYRELVLDLIKRAPLDQEVQALYWTRDVNGLVVTQTPLQIRFNTVRNSLIVEGALKNANS